VTTLLDRVDAIGASLKGRDELLAESEATRELTKLFAGTSSEVVNSAWGAKMASDVAGDEELGASKAKFVANYTVLKEKLVALWGKSPKTVDVSSPEEYSRALNSLGEEAASLQASALKSLDSLVGSLSKDRDLIRAISIIPDVKSEPGVFEEGIRFVANLKAALGSDDSLSELRFEKARSLLKGWKELKGRMDAEKKKADLSKLEESVSKPTAKFVEKLVESGGKAEFTLLTSEVVEELKESFPALAKRLEVSLK